MPNKRSDARSIVPEGAAAPRRRKTHAKAAPQLASQAEPEQLKSETTAVDWRDEIARLAYSYWEARGGEGGSAVEDWLRAETELRSRRKASTS